MSLLPVSPIVGVPRGNYNNSMPNPSDNMRVSNLKVPDVPLVPYNCDKLNLSSLQLGSSVIIEIPNATMVDNVMLGLTFKVGTIPYGAFLPRSWGYHAIRSIRYQYGGSREMTVSKECNFLMALAQSPNCDTRKKIVDMGGSVVVAGNEAADPTPEVGRVDQHAQVHLSLPHSRTCEGMWAPFDASSLSNPIRITIDFESADRLFTSNYTDPVVLPQAFDEGYFQYQSYKFVNQADSVRSLAGPGGSSEGSYEYWFDYVTSGGCQIIQGDDGSSGLCPAKVNLTGFFDGNLQGIMLAARKVRETGPSPGLVAPLAFEELTNIELSFSGNCIYKAASTDDRYWSLMRKGCDNSYATDIPTNDPPGPLPVPAGAGAGYPTAAFDGRFTYIPMTQFKDVCPEILQSGVNVGSNLLQVSFNTPESGVQYELFACYVYLGEINVRKGSAQIQLNSTSLVLNI